MKILIIKSVYIFFFLISINIYSQSMGYEAMLNTLLKKSVEPIKISDFKNEKSYILLDTRSKKEFNISHIKNAQWVGYEEFNINKMRNVSKNTCIIVYCSVGARSEQIGEKLYNAGFKNVKNLWGGIFQWVNEGQPILDKKGKLTNQIHAFSPEWGIWLSNGEKIYN
jgi:rhodanese-related sulfurtransferase